MRFINRNIRVADIARALDLRLDGTGKIHCWRPDRHKHGDRTASVGIRSTNNTVKCFGCGVGPIGPIDLVMDVRGVNAGEAAMWIAERFDVPTIRAGKRLEEPDRWRGPVGYERGLELLIRSGLWGTLSEAARSIAPVLLNMSEKDEPTSQESSIRMSYLGISRYSGIQSPNSVRRALVELSEIGFLQLPETGIRNSPTRSAARYAITPNSEALWELANQFSAQVRSEIAGERELRERSRKGRIRALREKVGAPRSGQKDSNAACAPGKPFPDSKAIQKETSPPHAVGTKYKPLYPTDSANQQHATRRIARSSTNGPSFDRRGEK
jgi:hypothetical protein